MLMLMRCRAIVMRRLGVVSLALALVVKPVASSNDRNLDVAALLQEALELDADVLLSFASRLKDARALNPKETVRPKQGMDREHLWLYSIPGS